MMNEFLERFPWPVHTVTVLRGPHARLPADLDRAVIFVVAEWSGPAIIAQRTLAAALGAVPAARQRLRLLAVDTESPGVLDEVRDLAPMLPFGGAGETLWISNGALLYATANYNQATTPALQMWTRRLLGETQAPD